MIRRAFTTALLVIAAGTVIRCAGDQRRLDGQMPGRFPEVPEGGAVWVFALK